MAITSTSQKQSGEQLATQLNLGEVLTWRLHWLVCRLETLKENACARRYPGGLQAPVESLTQELAGIMCEFKVLKTQTKIMLGLDYDDEIEPLLSYLPKYSDFLEQRALVKAKIEERANTASAAALKATLAKVEEAAETQ